MKFELRPVEEKPSRRSKYDQILDEFLDGDDDLAEVAVNDVRPYSIRLGLKNRIDSRNLGCRVKASMSKGIVYLERLHDASTT